MISISAGIIIRLRNRVNSRFFPRKFNRANANAAGMNTIVGYVYDMLYGNSGGYPSFASAAALILFAIVLTITCINLLISRKNVQY